MTDTDALLADSSPEVRAIFGELMRVCRDAMPGAAEQLDLPDRLVAFGFGQSGGTRLRDFAVALIPHSVHVNVQLADGALLDDPTGIVEGTGKRIRHVKCRSLDDVARPALRQLLVEQAARRTGSD
jgi:hypothetical protein